MNDIYEVKNLVVAMPSTGKTYYTRTVNAMLPRHLRPAIDFDYTGPRLSGDDLPDGMLDAQTDLINSFLQLPHVHTIFVHPDAVEWFDISKAFNITFVLPADVSVLLSVVERCKKRDGECPFTRDYAKFAQTWWFSNIKLAAKLVYWGYNVSIVEFGEGDYLSDVYDPNNFHPGGKLLNFAHEFHVDDMRTSKVHEYGINRDQNHRELVRFLMAAIAHSIEYRGALHDVDKGDRSRDCSYHHNAARHHYNHTGNIYRSINLVDVIENICDVVATSAERGFWDPPRQSAEFYESAVRDTMNHLRTLITDGCECKWDSEPFDVSPIVEQ